MPSPRVLTLVLAAVALAVGLWAWQSAPDGGQGATGTFAVSIQGPTGVIWSGNITGDSATAYSVLVAAGQAGAFGIDVQETALGGDCGGLYVVGIAGHDESGAAGWNYYVRHDGGAFEWMPVSAACCALRPGDAVEWRWVDNDRTEVAGICG